MFVYDVYFGDDRQGTVYLNEMGLASKTVDTQERTTSYVYDEYKRLAAVIDASGNESAIEYDTRGNMTKITGSNGAVTTMEYDASDQIAKITYATGRSLTYAYDKLGRLTSVTDGHAYHIKYTYNEYGLLQKVLDGASSNALMMEYAYDDKGNVTRETHGNGTYTQYVYDTLGFLTSKATFDSKGKKLASFDYTYDANGAMTGKTNLATKETWTYTWDPFGQLRSTVRKDQGGTVLERWDYEYDVLGNRTAMVHVDADSIATRSEYLFDPTGLGNVVAQYDAEGNIVSTYAYGYGLLGGTNADGNAVYYGFDHLGSTAVITGADGTVLNKYAYDPFGKVLSQSEQIETPFQFVGEYGVISGQNDSLLSMRARWYDPATGQFVSEDPIGLEAGDANLYRYCGNSITAEIDPSGLRTVETNIGNTYNRANSIGQKRLDALNAIADGDFDAYDQFYEQNNRVVEHARDTTRPYLRFRFGWGVLINWLRPVWSDDTQETRYAASLTDDMVDQKLNETDNDFPIPDIPDKNIDLLAQHRIEQPQSFDPNEINGPVGFDFEAYNAGTEEDPYLVITSPNWTSGTSEQVFTIYFENKSTASAAAQEVWITTQLPETFDWDTFTLSEICIGNQIFTQMAGSGDGRWVLQQTSTGEQIQLTVTFDADTGLAHWYMRSFVASTFDHFPVSAYDGFLPPNDDTGIGQAYVKFAVRLDEDTPTDTVVETFASIIFDLNDPIITNVWKNTIDSTAPTSRVSPLSETTNQNRFLVSWTGSDAEHRQRESLDSATKRRQY